MKKITLLLISLFFISCQIEDNQFNLNTNQDSELKRQTNSCALNNQNPFTVQSLTHGYSFFNGISYCVFDNTYPNEPCFATELDSELIQEFDPQPLIRNYPLSGTYTINITMSDYIDASNLFPYISASNSNIIYEELVCQIRSNFNQLPSLPPNKYYGIKDLDIQCVFPFSGPENTTLNVEYIIKVIG